MRSRSPRFQISFSYDNRIVAQKVTADLVSRFMTENTRERTTQSVLTTQFLKDQLESAKKELDMIEQKLTNFRTSANGRLPDQVQQNAAQMSMLEQRISNLNAALGRIGQDKMLLESDLRSVKNQRVAIMPTLENAVRRPKNDRVTQIDRDIMQMEANLSTLRQHYKDTYPDAPQAPGAAHQHEADARQDPGRGRDRKRKRTRGQLPPDEWIPCMSAKPRQLDAAIERIEAQLKVKDNEAKNYNAEIANTEKALKVIQARIQSTPVSEQQYGDIIRDREVAKLKYDDLNKKRAQSQIAEDLERRQQGETLEVLDPASLPQSPTQPKRGVIYRRGYGNGLGDWAVSCRSARGERHISEKFEGRTRVHAAHDSGKRAAA